MKSFKEILTDARIPFKDGKIEIPAWVQHIKLDIGLSYNAPMTQQWLSTEENLLVFAFEPNPNSLRAIFDKNNKKRGDGHGTPLENRFLNDRAFVIPVALGSTKAEIDLYITDIDEGSSSIYKPKESFRNVSQIARVPLLKLADFMELIPWADQNPGQPNAVEFIEYVKIDAQGNDLEIVKGMEDYISKVVFITLEPESSTYYNCEGNNLAFIVQYMKSRNFSFVKHVNTHDPTFVNNAYLHLIDKIYIYQKG
jgi:hypothetical protein